MLNKAYISPMHEKKMRRVFAKCFLYTINIDLPENSFYSSTSQWGYQVCLNVYKTVFLTKSIPCSRTRYSLASSREG